MRIAFYAPLKPSDHPIPSGDRRVARLFVSALSAGGHAVFIASRFRSYDARGDRIRQARLASLGGRLAERLLHRYRQAPDTAPELWFTYHLYHKAPDWLGPVIAEEIGIPYVVAEASDAPKQARGSWAMGRDASARAISRADAVIGLNSADQGFVLPLLQDAARWISLKPFVDTASFGGQRRSHVGPPRLIAIGMMRYGDKLASYQILGDALSHLLDLSWSLEVVGNGPARRGVEDALSPIKTRVTWTGAIGSTAIAERLAAADLCVWPAIDEAFGMALLEAQASGLPVVAGAGGGVGDIVVPGITGLLTPPGDVAAFADAVRRLVLDRGQRLAFGTAARHRVRSEHDIFSAAQRLNLVLKQLRQPQHGSSGAPH